jgi:hypothetical protein
MSNTTGRLPVHPAQRNRRGATLASRDLLLEHRTVCLSSELTWEPATGPHTLPRGLRQAKPAAAHATIAHLRRVPSLLVGQIRRVFSRGTCLPPRPHRAGRALVAPRAARNCAISLGPSNHSVLWRPPCHDADAPASHGAKRYRTKKSGRAKRKHRSAEPARIPRLTRGGRIMATRRTALASDRPKSDPGSVRGPVAPKNPISFPVPESTIVGVAP